jgi:hypothetical protein
VVLYEDAFRLYSGLDASLLLEKRGKQGVKSVLYADFGVSVLDEDGTAWLYDTATGRADAGMETNGNAYSALRFGNGGGTWLGEELEPAEFIGAGMLGEDDHAYATSDGMEVNVVIVKPKFRIQAGLDFERFSFPVTGRAEVYFTGGFVFVSPLHGDATVYTQDGVLLRTFEETGYMAETGVLGDFITASYVVSSSERYTLLLDAKTLGTIAVLPGFMCETDDGTVVLDDGAGHLRAAKIRSLIERADAARERLSGRDLTSAEMKRFKAD